MGTNAGKGSGRASTTAGRRQTWDEATTKGEATLVKRQTNGDISLHKVAIEAKNDQLIAKDKATGAILGSFSRGKKNFIYGQDDEGNAISLHEGSPERNTRGRGRPPKVVSPESVTPIASGQAGAPAVNIGPKNASLVSETPLGYANVARASESEEAPSVPNKIKASMDDILKVTVGHETKAKNKAVKVDHEKISKKTIAKKAKEEKEKIENRKQLSQSVIEKENWPKTYNDIDKARKAAGFSAAKLPDEIKEITKGQPISEALYRMVDQGPMPEAEIEQKLREGLERDSKKTKRSDASPKGYFDLDALVKRFDAGIAAYELDPKLYSSLTKSEKAMVVYYTKYGDETMNSHMKEMAKVFANLEKTTDPKEKAEAAEKVSEYLGDEKVKQNSLMTQTLMNALAKMPKYQGTTYRGTDAMENIEPGNLTFSGGFSSTTYNDARKGFWDKSGQFAIKTTRGVDINPFSWFNAKTTNLEEGTPAEETDSDEGEVLTFPGFLYRVDMKLADMGEGINYTGDYDDEDEKQFVAMREMQDPTTVTPHTKADKRPGAGRPLFEEYQGPKKELTPEEVKEANERVDAFIDETLGIGGSLGRLSGNAKKAAEEMYKTS
jgi:hypothetical protein